MTRQLRLPLRPFEVGSGELAERMGVTDQTIRRWADALGITYHDGPGRHVRWSDAEQRDLVMVGDLIGAGFKLAQAAELVAVVPERWEYGWAMFYPEWRIALHAENRDELIRETCKGIGLLVVLPLGQPAIVDVPTGGLV